MIADALFYANPVFKFDENILKPEEYLKFTDGLLEQIEYSTNPELKESSNILKNIKKRNIYRFVGEVLI